MVKIDQTLVGDITCSHFAFSVVLGKKKDADYRALDKKNIKNKYPIPRIDELINELHVLLQD